MICYTLKCAKGHEFDSWFQSATAFERLAGHGHVACGICGDVDVEKSLMAPRVVTDKDDAPALSRPASKSEKALAAFRARIEAETEDVGSDFARIARDIHFGEEEERAIRGDARADEARALIEEGVPIAPLPWARRSTN